MKPFFHTPARLARLAADAHRIVGTPFVPHAMLPGAGFDCIHAAAWLYQEAGHLKSFHPPKYSIDGGNHNLVSQVTAWLAARPDFQRVTTPQPGDLLIYRLGRSEHHVAVQLNAGELVQALPRHGLVIMSVGHASLAARLTAAYRPLELSAMEVSS